MLIRHALKPLSRSVTSRSSTTRLFSTSLRNDADFTHVVIGGGAVGLAIARQLAARDGTSTLLIERHGMVGSETSSRNSEVIHAGLYYGHNTLKTDLCIRGRQMMYALCAAKSIPHRNTKKWIVAQDSQQMNELQKVHDFASSIDVPTHFLPRSQITEREPDVRAEAGVLESTTTGIVDSHAFMSFLEADFVDKGGELVLHTSVSRIEREADGTYKIYTKPMSSSNSNSNSNSHTNTNEEEKDGGRGEETIISTETLINSAGLNAITLSNHILPKSHHITPHYAKGTYFSYSARHPKPRTLVYPAPVPGHGGLGTHLTLDLTNQIRFGPDVEWIDDPTDLTPNESRLGEALDMIETYLPGIQRDAVKVDYCGVRPKLGKTSGTSGPNFADFYIREEKEVGLKGFVNLLGIESPGLTSSLAVAELVEGILYGGKQGVGLDGDGKDKKARERGDKPDMGFMQSSS